MHLFLRREIEALGSEQSVLEELFKFEQMSSAELLLMMNLRVFPSAEVGAVRKEMQLLKEQPGEDENSESSDQNALAKALEKEVRVAEKKAMLFRSRRLDEERIVGQHFADIADGVQHSIDADTGYYHQDNNEQQSRSGQRRPARDSARF